MAKVLTDPQHYTAIANAIRAKTGGSETYTSAQMAGAIEAIQTGFGGKLQDKTVTPTSEQQTITADDGFDGLKSVTVVGVEGGALAENEKVYQFGSAESVFDFTSFGVTSSADSIVT